MSDDITFCGSECNNTRCRRHMSNIKEPQYPHSVALLEGTEYCEKKHKPTSVRLIDTEALKKQVKALLDLAVKRVNDTPTNSPCYRMYVEQENERARLLDLIDNAPTEKCEDCPLNHYGMTCTSHRVEYQKEQRKND